MVEAQGRGSASVVSTTGPGQDLLLYVEDKTATGDGRNGEVSHRKFNQIHAGLRKMRDEVQNADVVRHHDLQETARAWS